jgi:hypothetical protein
MRTSGRALGAFACLHYWGLGTLTFVLLAIPTLVWPVLAASSVDYLIEALVRLLIFASITGLLACCVHRVIGAIVATWWLSRGMLPDGRWAAKIVDYESVFVWCVFLCNFVFALLAWGLGLVVPMSTGLYVFSLQYLGLTANGLAWVVLNLSLLGVWLWRYRKARLAIRWSNF